ncbi:hypothetical protein BaRGS_00030457 [Batillaria attramentaria]|uniref:Methyltransferase FkbM domain-containing protein n=1 Tax=Batillaria attramentaria TaxID=370345 RepID=A0ABD0JUJ0_9CAEN
MASVRFPEQVFVLLLVCLVGASIITAFYFLRQFPFSAGHIKKDSYSSAFSAVRREPNEPRVSSTVNIVQQQTKDSAGNSPAVDQQPETDSPGIKPPVEVFQTTVSRDEHCTDLMIMGKRHGPIICTRSPSECSMAAAIQRDHNWEGDKVDTAMKVMAKFDRDPLRGRVSLFDAGCNQGVFTITAAYLGYEVLAIDTVKKYLELVATSLRKNKLTSKVTLVRNALSSDHRKVFIPQDTSHLADWYDPKANGKPPTDRVVYAVTMDDLIPLVRTERVFLKMDIERSEGRALRGASKFFGEIEVVCIFMEWEWVKRREDDRRFILKFLTTQGFQAYRQPTDQKPLPADDSMSWPHDVYWQKPN